MAEKYTTAKMIEALREKHGNLSAAARYLGCDRHTIVRYINTYPTVQAGAGSNFIIGISIQIPRTAEGLGSRFVSAESFEGSGVLCRTTGQLSRARIERSDVLAMKTVPLRNRITSLTRVVCKLMYVFSKFRFHVSYSFYLFDTSISEIAHNVKGQTIDYLLFDSQFTR